jgi:SPP1 family predicted phage head-tail adaptor
MRSGPLRNRIEIQEPTEARDAAGGGTVTFATVATRYGAVEPLSARERLIAGQMGTRVAVRIRLRWYEGLTTRHRLKMGTRTFQLIGVVQPDERKIEHVCDAVEVA